MHLSFIHSFIYSFIHLFVHSFMHSYTHSLIHSQSLIHTFILTWPHTDMFYLTLTHSYQSILVLATVTVSAAFLCSDKRNSDMNTHGHSRLFQFLSIRIKRRALYFKGTTIHSSIIKNNMLYSRLTRVLDPVPGYYRYWKLCYRASSHGWAASTFHSRCNGKPHTVTIIRKSQYVFGGYTDIAWGKNINQYKK